MTKSETERLKGVEDNQKATNDKLDYLIGRFDKFVDESEKRFITRLEGKIAVGVVTLAIAFVTFWFNVKEHIK
jgi:hypothetical protein